MAYVALNNVYIHFCLFQYSNYVRPTWYFNPGHGNEPFKDILSQPDGGVPHQAPGVRVRIAVLPVLGGRRRIGKGIVILEGVIRVVVFAVGFFAGVIVNIQVFAIQKGLEEKIRFTYQ